MKGSDFVRGLPEAAGPDRDSAIFAAVKAGDSVVEWTPIELTIPEHRAVLDVTSDALAVGDPSDWVRFTTNHTTAQLIADAFDAVLPTTRISDLIFAKADVRLTPCLQKADAQMSATTRMLQHHEAVEATRNGRPGLVATVGKDWVMTNRLVGHPDRGANYGWHDAHAPNGRVWQPLGLAHNRFHVDYSQTLRLVRRKMIVDGNERDIVDVLRDRTLAPLVSDEGPIELWRLAAVPEGAGSAPGGPPPPTPPIVRGDRILRRPMSGPDVAAWQRAVGVTADGLFGPATEEATRRWQADHGLTPDGVVGPATRAAAKGQAPPSVPPPTPPNTVRGDREYPFVQARNFTSTSGRSISLIVLHTMEAPEKPNTARAVANWFASANAPQASAHYCIDADDTIQCVRERDVAWAAPGANHNGIHLEHAGYARQSAEDWADDYSSAVLARSAMLCAALCSRYGIAPVLVDANGLKAGNRGITTHAAVSAAFHESSHTDPGVSFPMYDFLRAVAQT